MHFVSHNFFTRGKKYSSFFIKSREVKLQLESDRTLRRWEYQSIVPASWETCVQDKKQQLELDMEQWTGSKLGKQCKAYHPACLGYKQSTSYKMLGWMTYKRESRLLGEISTTSDIYICRSQWRGNKEPLDEGERGKWKSWLKTQHSKN